MTRASPSARLRRIRCDELVPSIVFKINRNDGLASMGLRISMVNRSRRFSAPGASVETLTDLETRPLCDATVFIFAVSVPDPPAGMTESNSATVQPQEGAARRI